MTTITTKEELLKHINQSSYSTKEIVELNNDILEVFLSDLKEKLNSQIDLSEVESINKLVETILVVATNTYYDNGEVIMSDHLFDGQDGPSQMLKVTQENPNNLFSSLTTNYFQLYVDTFVKMKQGEFLSQHRESQILTQIADPSSLRSDAQEEQKEEKSKAIPEVYLTYASKNNFKITKTATNNNSLKEAETVGNVTIRNTDSEKKVTIKKGGWEKELKKDKDGYYIISEIQDHPSAPWEEIREDIRLTTEEEAFLKKSQDLSVINKEEDKQQPVKDIENVLEELWDKFKEEEEIPGELGSSIEKAVDTVAIRNGLVKIMQEHGAIVYTPKYDGASGYVTYENNRLSSVLQRGKGSKGPNMTIQALAMDKDIPHNIKTSSIDSVLDEGDRVQARGEIIIQMIKDKEGKFSEEATLEKLNTHFPPKKDGSPAYNNLRNGVAGLMKKEGLDPEIVKEYITFVPFHLYKISPDGETEKIEESLTQEFFKENGMREVPYVEITPASDSAKDIEKAADKTMLLYNLTDYVGNNLEIPEDIMKKMISELGKETVEKIINNPYITDGAVFANKGNEGKVDERTKNIEGYIAAKYSAPTGQSKILGFITRMNKGNISFRVQIEPIKVGGVVIEYLSGSVAETESIPHFLKIYKEGDVIRFKRSGGVIPNLLDPIKHDSLVSDIQDHLTGAFKEMQQEGIIDEEMHQFVERQIQLGLGSAYNSTSGAYWMQLRIALQNKLVEYTGKDKDKTIKKGINAVLEEVFSNLKSHFNLSNTKDIMMHAAKKASTFKTNYELEEVESKIEQHMACPSCSKDMALSETAKQMECTNDECEGRRGAAISSYMKLLQVDGSNSDMAITTAGKLIGFMKQKYNLQDNEGTMVSDFLRLYEMANDENIVEEMVAYKDLGFGKKSAEAFIKNMKNTVGAKEEFFIKALNIKNFGETMSKRLFAQIPFKTILDADLVNEATYKGIIDKMKEIEGFEEKSSEGFLSFIKQYQTDIRKLVEIVKPKVYEVKKLTVEANKEFVMTVTGSTTWEFLKKFSHGQTKKGVDYQDIEDDAKGGNAEAKEVLKNQGLVIVKGDMVAKVTGGRNPNGKTNFVISDDIADAVSKAKKLTNTVECTNAECALKEIEAGKCVLMTTRDFIDSFDAYDLNNENSNDSENTEEEKIENKSEQDTQEEVAEKKSKKITQPTLF